MLAKVFIKFCQQQIVQESTMHMHAALSIDTRIFMHHEDIQ